MYPLPFSQNLVNPGQIISYFLPQNHLLCRACVKFCKGLKKDVNLLGVNLFGDQGFGSQTFFLGIFLGVGRGGMDVSQESNFLWVGCLDWLGMARVYRYN